MSSFLNLNTIQKTKDFLEKLKLSCQTFTSQIRTILVKIITLSHYFTGNKERKFNSLTKIQMLTYTATGTMDLHIQMFQMSYFIAKTTFFTNQTWKNLYLLQRGFILMFQTQTLKKIA